MKSVEKLLALAFALLAFFASLAGTAGVVCAAGETAAGGALAPAPSPAPFDFRKGLAAAVAEKEASQFAFLDRVIAAGALSEDHRALLKAWSNGEIFKQTTTGAEDDDVATTTATGTTAAAVVLGAATPSGKCPLLSVATGEPLTGTDGKPLLVEPDALEPF
ncbi:MAG: hypothetical protein LBR07_07170, partial [Puniceicoccales bacterium]|nr:hypothetical protein [Puniceicoccales bacterium]